MGTEVQSKGYLPGYYSMRDHNDDANSCSCLPYYGDKSLSNGQCYNGFFSRGVPDAYDKDVVKRTMLEHESIFKNQVHELHRLYKIQRDLMDEFRRKEHDNRIQIKMPFSSNPIASQMIPEDAPRWHISGYPFPSGVDPGSSVQCADVTPSPFSSLKEKDVKVGPFYSPNGGSSKTSEVLESRPTKVRRMLDLQLPADEYIDTEEGQHPNEGNLSEVSIYHPKRSYGNTESDAKLLLGNGGKAAGRVDVSKCDLNSRRKNGLTDLKEPFQVEGANSSTFVGLHQQASTAGEISVQDLSSRTNSQFLGYPKKTVQKSHLGNGAPNDLLLGSNGNDSGWKSHVNEAGCSKSNLNCVSQDLQPEKMHLPVQRSQLLLDKGIELQRHIPNDRININLWRDGPNSGLEFSEEGLFSDFSGSWPHGVSSLEASGGSQSQKIKTIQPLHPHLNSSDSFSIISQPSADGWYVNCYNQKFGSELWNRNGICLGSSLGSKELPAHVSPVNYDYLSCNNDIGPASDHFISHGPIMGYKGMHFMDSKSAKDLNLNAVPLNTSCSEKFSVKRPEIIDLERKNEDHIPALPWLSAKSSCNQEETSVGRDSRTGNLSFLNPSSVQPLIKDGVREDPIQYHIPCIESASFSTNIEAKRLTTSDCPSSQKILGVPIFEKAPCIKSGLNFTPPTSASLPRPSECEVLENKRTNRVFDINLPCEPFSDLDSEIAEGTQAVETGKDTETPSFRHQIDLNSCASEDEISLIHSVPKTNRKVAVEIDLEAPAASEGEDDGIIQRELAEKQHEVAPNGPEQNADPLLDELVKVAAEAIISISASDIQSNLDDRTRNPSEASMADPLSWFVEIAFSCGTDIDSKFDSVSRGKGGQESREPSSEEMDYFEMMTLNLTETTKEEYMPRPLVPESIKMEEKGISPSAVRPRRGQARRGRQRRDFQRDILPGIASLSRHEVTEDLQTFGGLMRAMGHSWNCGLARRNSTRNASARGRRRTQVSPPPVAVATTCVPLMQQLNNIEAGLEDGSLTGWGKTTRRPRRQRCPAGNPPSFPVT